MENKKLFELDDDALDAVSGGTGRAAYTGKYDGHAVTLVSSRRCSKCGGSEALVFGHMQSTPYYVAVCNNPGCGGDQPIDGQSILFGRPSMGLIYENEVTADYGSVL